MEDTSLQVMGPPSKVPIFDGKRFLYWESMMGGLLYEKRLWEVVSRNVKCPPPGFSGIRFSTSSTVGPSKEPGEEEDEDRVTRL